MDSQLTDKLVALTEEEEKEMLRLKDYEIGRASCRERV